MYRLFLGKISTLSTRPLPHKLAAQAPQGSRRASWLAGRVLLAQAVSPQGKLIDDFLFVTTARSIHTCNAPSPAATSAIPIGAHIVSKVQTLLASQSNPGRTLRAARSVETLHAAFTR